VLVLRLRRVLGAASERLTRRHVLPDPEPRLDDDAGEVGAGLGAEPGGFGAVEFEPPDVGGLPDESADAARFDTGPPGNTYTRSLSYIDGTKIPGSVSLYAPGKLTVGLGLNDPEPPATLSCTHAG